MLDVGLVVGPVVVVAVVVGVAELVVVEFVIARGYCS